MNSNDEAFLRGKRETLRAISCKKKSRNAICWKRNCVTGENYSVVRNVRPSPPSITKNIKQKKRKEEKETKGKGRKNFVLDGRRATGLYFARFMRDASWSAHLESKHVMIIS